MEENNKKNKKIKGLYFLLEFAAIAAAAGGTFFLSKIHGAAGETALRNAVFAVTGIGIIGFHLRRECLYDTLDYDNGEHYLRFWTSLLFCLAAALACSFLPSAGWPFVAVYVILTLFSNTGTGILAASVLLMLPVLMAAESVGIFFLYFVSGVFAATLFRHLEQDFKVGIPLFLSLFCLLLCETAGTVLTANALPDLELFVIPGANVILTGILLTGFLKIFSSMVVYKYRERYLELNDTENPLLAELKNTSREAYFLGIHTAYFCERIGSTLQLDVDALKCAAYYHKMGEGLKEVMAEHRFPPGARAILNEYLDKKTLPRQKETAVLLCSDAVLASVKKATAQSDEANPDYDKIIDAVFKGLTDGGIFHKCSISIGELHIIQKRFKEEKLYYDFLR